jgi:hypothetical protein
MSTAYACLVVLCTALAAAGASFLLRRSWRIEARRRHQEAGSIFFLQLGVLFSVLLAFVFSEVWGEYNTASQAINGEVAALHGAAIVAAILPGPSAETVIHAIGTYGNTVAQTEWPLMEHRQASPDAVHDLTSLLQTVARLDLAAPRDQANQAHILDLLTDAHTQRETRIFQMEQGLPHALWLILLIYTAVLVACVVMAGLETAASHAVFAGAFAGCIVMVLVVVRMLDYPFEGALALPNADFLKLGRDVAALSQGG